MNPTGKGSRGKPETGPKKIQAVFKQAKALNLRIQGWTLSEIAREVGYKTDRTAYSAIVAALRDHVRPVATLYRDIQLSRLELLLKTWLPYATQPQKTKLPDLIGQDGEVIEGAWVEGIPSKEAAQIVLATERRISSLLGLETDKHLVVTMDAEDHPIVRDVMQTIIASKAAREKAAELAEIVGREDEQRRAGLLPPPAAVIADAEIVEEESEDGSE
jgi:hypothetical protein